MSISRVFLIVLDSCGAGALPDAADYGDFGVNTLRTVSRSPHFHIPTLRLLGIGNMDGLDFLGKAEAPLAACARLAERSRGKDTTTGHWEIAGLISGHPMPTFPDGFPEEVLSAFRKATGRGVLCNKPYSGTQVIVDYGRQHEETGDLIVYTSADSVFQIAAHTDVVPLETLYDYCRAARRILTGKYGVGRVIARPFTGSYPGYTRTADRRDFSLLPPAPTVLDALKGAGLAVLSVGKISDIFAGQGITKAIPAHGNAEGMKATAEAAREEFRGLCFTNLVDFDMLYGHRRDIDGYAKALTAFDGWLRDFLPTLRADDVLMITADHGCDPAYLRTTDHTREYVPLLVYSRQIVPQNFGTRSTYADIAATLAKIFGVCYDTVGAPLSLNEKKAEG